MFTLSKVKLPAAIEVAGDLYPIHTDFRFWLIFSKLIKDKKTILGDLDFLYEGIKPFNRIDGYNELMRFYSPTRILPRKSNTDGIQLLDYELDAELIYSAFYEVYKIDLLDESLRLHWHKFLALLSGLHNTKLNEVMKYRSYDKNDKTTLETQMQSLKKMWELPQNKELSESTKKFNNLLAKRK